MKWTYFYLYVILDVFSRYVVGWMIAHRESARLAQKLIAETCARQGIAPSTLTLHADRGSSMISKPVALLLADLGVTKTHSRPHVSNDNPFSEAQFKTLKYRPDFPERFVGGVPRPPARPTEVWINPPPARATSTSNPAPAGSEEDLDALRAPYSHAAESGRPDLRTETQHLSITRLPAAIANEADEPAMTETALH